MVLVKKSEASISPRPCYIKNLSGKWKEIKARRGDSFFYYKVPGSRTLTHPLPGYEISEVYVNDLEEDAEERGKDNSPHVPREPRPSWVIHV